MSNSQHVLFETRFGPNGHLGLITLNRPEALNALNYPMILAMSQQLIAWAKDDSIKAVVIKAVPGRAFCAGGDIRQSYELMRQQDPAALKFFHDEYVLNHLIYHYPKPYIALLDGITMGGGVGVSVHGSHRVASNKLNFAMPETGIGFFPDVGGTYFLSRLPYQMGYYLGLSGARINCDDCFALGLVQYKVKSESFEVIIDRLADSSFSEDANQSVTNIINEFIEKPEPSRLIENKDCIMQTFSAPTVEEIMMAMDARSTHFTINTRSLLMSKSPTSLKVTLAAIRSAEQLEFDACMQQEYCLASHFIEQPDFAEGVRSVLIDKDRSPAWLPDALGKVTDQYVSSFFQLDSTSNKLNFVVIR